MSATFDIIFSRSAKRALEVELPEKVAAAAIEFILGALRENPYRVGKRLRPPLDAYYSSRRGQYRVVYQVFDHRVVIEIVSIAHRRDVYRG